MNRLFIILIALTICGCTAIPYKDLNLDTTSNFNPPPEGKAGIYVYQWKTGIIGAGADVDFEIKGMPKIPLNTGEYAYFEIIPGLYEYKLIGGMSDLFIPVEFEGNKNYFFRASLMNFSDSAVLVRDQVEINAAKKNILSGRYEISTRD